MHYCDQPCRRLIASDGLPDRAGQPTQIHLHMTLDGLMRLNESDRPVQGPAAAPHGHRRLTGRSANLIRVRSRENSIPMGSTPARRVFREFTAARDTSTRG